MKKVILFACLTITMFGCVDQSKDTTGFDKGKLYRIYFHVSREINDDEEEVYFYDSTPLNRMQRDTLISILKDYNFDYKLCADSSIMVSTISVPDATTMALIDAQLKNKIGKKGHNWSKQ